MGTLIIVAIIVWILVVIIRAATRKANSRTSRRPNTYTRLRTSKGDSISVQIDSRTDYSATRERKPVDPDSVWVPSNNAVQIAGREITGGMLYVGQYLQAANGYGSPDASLINPKLKVDWTSPDYQGANMSYWPSYSQIQPSSRAAYLDWLSSGRCDPNANIGYVFLFFYGLERRALVDSKTSDLARSEIPAIKTEVERLLQLYSSNHSFHGYASAFIDALTAMTGFDHIHESTPPLTRVSWELPGKLLIGLGQFAAKGVPIPASWAFSWVSLHPETILRTPATRCASELQQLFEIRYSKEFGSGMIVKPNKSRLTRSYQPASPSVPRPMSIPCGDLPDVSKLSVPVNKLRRILDDCTNALDSLSRYRGKHPGAADCLDAIALMPAELFSTLENARLRQVQSWIAARIRGSSTRARLSEILAIWTEDPQESLSKNEVIPLVQLFEKLGYGMEPDPRFGGGTIKADEWVVLFKLPADAPKIASTAYSAAVLLLHLAANISASDGAISISEREYLDTHIYTALKLSAGEKTRLKASLDRLLLSSPSTAGIKGRVEALGLEEKRAIATFCVGVAGADGRIEPSEIKALTKLYPILGLPPTEVYTQIHSLMSQAQPTPANEPQAVGSTEQPSPGYRIPVRPSVAEMSATGVALDMRVVQAKLKETALVTKILGDVFKQDEEAEDPQTVVVPAVPEKMVGTLDANHSKLFEVLAVKPEWSRMDYEALAEEHGLLPDGALDLINETAYQLCKAPLTEGEDPIVIDMQVAKEMRG